jgi:hypothetical protein
MAHAPLPPPLPPRIAHVLRSASAATRHASHAPSQSASVLPASSACSGWRSASSRNDTCCAAVAAGPGGGVAGKRGGREARSLLTFHRLPLLEPAAPDLDPPPPTWLGRRVHPRAELVERCQRKAAGFVAAAQRAEPRHHLLQLLLQLRRQPARGRARGGGRLLAAGRHAQHGAVQLRQQAVQAGGVARRGRGAVGGSLQARCAVWRVYRSMRSRRPAP